jgi:hypothetical protein
LTRGGTGKLPVEKINRDVSCTNPYPSEYAAKYIQDYEL